MTRLPFIEPLEARIAPAVTIINPIFDITAGIGKTGATIDLATMVDPAVSYRTIVEFDTNFILPGTTTPGKIVIELFDDKAPLSVQNFLSYVNGKPGANYDGTFFHRIFDFGAGSGTGTDIIQGGGFDVSNINAHIPVGPTLHNEFNASDPEVQNIRGTIAMAKTAVSPNTATSEWFINLTDNSEILGEENNGGFTVFGAVRQGMEFVDAIGAAKKINQGGALTDLPVQNHISGTPTSDQLIQIVDARVIPATLGNANGHTFDSQVTVTNVNGGGPSDLLTAKVDPATNQLKLSYNPGKSGQADVTVTVSKNGETTTDTFRVTVQPNLVTQLTSHTLASTYVPGDKGTAKVLITNTAGGLAKGAVEVKLYLSQVDADGDNQLDDDAFKIDETDQLLATKIQNINIKSGKSTTIPVSFLVQDVVDSIALVQGKQYVVIAEVVPAAGGAITELFSDDNAQELRTGHTYSLSFGAVGGRSNIPVTVNGPGDVPMTFKLTGSGVGTVIKGEDGRLDVTISGSNAKSSFSVKTAKGDIGVIEDLTITETIGSVKIGNVNLQGHFVASGGAKSIVLGNLGDPTTDLDRDFSVNAFPNPSQKLSVSLGTVTDYSFNATMPVAKLTSRAWVDTEGTTAPNQIYAQSLGNLRINGDLEADVVVADDIKVGQIVVNGAVRDVTIKALGDIGTFKAQSISGSSVFAGLAAKPAQLADFVLTRTISNFTITGTFADTVVAAARLTNVNLGSVDEAAGFNVGGIYADAIKSYIRKGTNGDKLKNLDDTDLQDFNPTIYNAGGNYQVALF